MINVLSIYNFSLPFVEWKYSEAKRDSFVSSFYNFLLYEWLNPNKNKIKKWFVEEIKLIFDWWEALFILYSWNDYFIPNFKFDLYLNDVSFNLKEKIYKKLFDITFSLWVSDYIYDLDDNNIHKKIKNWSKIVTIKDMENNFNIINQSTFEKFLKNTNKIYIKEQLITNRSIKIYMIYLIYICYVFYSNYFITKSLKSDLDKIISSETFDVYKENANLFKLRLTTFSDLSIYQFKSYYLILNNFFSLFDNV